MNNKRIMIISIVIVAIIAIGLSVYLFTPGDYVAKVGNEKITKAEYSFFLSSIRNDMESIAGQDKAAFWNSEIGGISAKDQAKTTALEEVQKYKIQAIRAKENNLKLSVEEIKKIDTSIDDQIKQIGGDAEAEKQVKSLYNISMIEYRAIVKGLTLVSKLMDQEMKKIEVTEDKTKDYYNKNKDTLDQVTIRHVLLSIKDANNQPLPDAQQQEKKKKADDILAKVKAGEEIGDLAKQYSEDPGSKDNNGEYTFPKGQMVKEFEEWAFSAKINDASVVKTDFGYHVMKMIKRTSYEDLKSNIQTEYQKNEYNSVLETWKKDPKYNVKKNNKVYDSISIL